MTNSPATSTSSRPATPLSPPPTPPELPPCLPRASALRSPPPASSTTSPPSAASSHLDHIDLQECRRRQCRQCLLRELRDGAVGLLIDALRKVSAGDRFIRTGGWSVAGDYCLGNQMKGKKIGLLGLGSIGSKVAKRLEAFGCTILYNSRENKPYVSYPYCSYVCELAASSDVLVICCALTDQTRHMINREGLTALGNEGAVINIGHGPIIDDKELVRSLQEGEIAGAGFDVLENEPGVPNELFALDIVVLSPHLAFYTREAFRDMFEHVKGNLQAFFSIKPLLSPGLD